MNSLNLPHKIMKFHKYQDFVANVKYNDKRYVINLPTDDKVIYLTFDFCPNLGLETEMLHWLVDNNHKATLFLSHKWISMNSDKDLSILRNSNFEICAHGWNHINPLLQSDDEQIEEIEKSVSYIKDNWNENLKWYRSPHGYATETTFKTLDRLGLQFASWQGTVFDKTVTESIDVNHMAIWQAKYHTKSGDIWIMHANGEGKNTFQLLKQLTNIIQESGFEYRMLP